jgi:hypothetical protein
VKLPSDTGYAVNVESRTVHTRHPGSHAGPVRRVRSADAVEYLLDGKRPKFCKTCYPSSEGTPPPDVKAPTNGQVRRKDDGDDAAPLS